MSIANGSTADYFFAVVQYNSLTGSNGALRVIKGDADAIIAAAEYTDNLYEYTPMQIKQAITGYGKADKKQIQQMVKMLLRMDELPKPDDAADALAIAICHSRSATSLMNTERVFDANRYDTR